MHVAKSEARKSAFALAIAVLLPVLMIYLAMYVYPRFGNKPIIDACFYIALLVTSIFLIKLFKLSITPRHRSVQWSLIGVLVGLGATIPVGGVAFLLRGALNLPESALTPLQNMQTLETKVVMTVNVIQVGILAPICEEAFFRVLLAQQLKRSMSMPWAILLSSGVFAAYHGFALNVNDLLDFYRMDYLPLLASGVILGALYFRLGWPAAVAAHLMFNTRQFYIGYHTDTWLSIVWLLLALAGLVFTILLFIPRFNRRIHEH